MFSFLKGSSAAEIATTPISSPTAATSATFTANLRRWAKFFTFSKSSNKNVLPDNAVETIQPSSRIARAASHTTHLVDPSVDSFMKNTSTHASTTTHNRVWFADANLAVKAKAATMTPPRDADKRHSMPSAPRNPKNTKSTMATLQLPTPPPTMPSTPRQPASTPTQTTDAQFVQQALLAATIRIAELEAQVAQSHADRADTITAIDDLYYNTIVPAGLQVDASLREKDEKLEWARTDLARLNAMWREERGRRMELELEFRGLRKRVQTDRRYRGDDEESSDCSTSSDWSFGGAVQIRGDACAGPSAANNTGEEEEYDDNIDEIFEDFCKRTCGGATTCVNTSSSGHSFAMRESQRSA